MAKAIKEYDLVFSEDEVRLVVNARNVATEKIARQHFLNRGMTEEEIDKTIKFGRVWESVAEIENEDGTPHCFLVELSVEVEELVD